MSGAELIADIINWKWYLLTLVVYGIAPGLLLRVIVLAFEKDDPRRQELVAELYAVPFIKRPYWVAQQLETALTDGIWPRFMLMLTGRVIYRWKLGDGDKRNKKYPRTFEVPSPQMKSLIVPGVLVKLVFEPSLYPGGIEERMWVRVTKVGLRRLEGRLENNPMFYPRLDYSDTVKFKRKHIIDIDIDIDDEHPVVDAA